ncbi:hypothetical protein A1Q1_04748 [Trichosporon asahii var. asahii CBS 2479]|uniref:Uncharacterized protein n=1 Tax=Trichosporon asahii var. asahii (strain ATCC 90039 / CBS 2479 / JCM 2466 / KCTC 7840 / NBRC 103889/ NCYC 2677 / UAMH 7654) TaxID=1186058 RepID=J5SN78_TRIAS|nr:hypothetical protein A1Q1_04748 [Trichosporon asahii var. asahii CBS 2479]EJT46571.1 hypothetical protein A1Q1_04748 [Trichosporon asahii var. asahii CBS 2479]
MREQVTRYSFRHFATQRMKASGVSFDAVQEVLVHVPGSEAALHCEGKRLALAVPDTGQATDVNAMRLQHNTLSAGTRASRLAPVGLTAAERKEVEDERQFLPTGCTIEKKRSSTPEQIQKAHKEYESKRKAALSAKLKAITAAFWKAGPLTAARRDGSGTADDSAKLQAWDTDKGSDDEGNSDFWM